MWFKKHFTACLAILSNIPNLWRGLIWLFDWGERIQSISTKLREAGG